MSASSVRITACLIVRNEQPFLAGCLESISPVVDEIIVVDTGSTDASRQISKDGGARLIEEPWRGDFAAARNIGLDAATGDWILYIDADERLRVTEPAELKSALDDPSAFAARVRFLVRRGFTAYWEYRLFRNDRRLRFRGAIHESIRPDLDHLRQTIGAGVIDAPAEIVHLGYDGDMAAKYRRNLPLLQLAVETDPDRLYYWNDLALSLAGLGMIEEAIESCDRGLAVQARSGRDRDIIGSLLTYTSAQLRLPRGDDVLSTIDLGLRLYPPNWSLQLLKARALVNLRRYHEALPILGALTSIDPDSICDDSLGHDRRIFGEFAHDLAGVALLRSGRRAEAAEAFQRAALAAPDNDGYRIKALSLAVHGAAFHKSNKDGLLEKESGVVTRQ